MLSVLDGSFKFLAPLPELPPLPPPRFAPHFGPAPLAPTTPVAAVSPAAIEATSAPSAPAAANLALSAAEQASAAATLPDAAGEPSGTLLPGLRNAGLVPPSGGATMVRGLVPVPEAYFMPTATPSANGATARPGVAMPGPPSSPKVSPAPVKDGTADLPGSKPAVASAPAAEGAVELGPASEGTGQRLFTKAEVEQATQAAAEQLLASRGDFRPGRAQGLASYTMFPRHLAHVDQGKSRANPYTHAWNQSCLDALSTVVAEAEVTGKSSA